MAKESKPGAAFGVALVLAAVAYVGGTLVPTAHDLRVPVLTLQLDTATPELRIGEEALVRVQVLGSVERLPRVPVDLAVVADDESKPVELPRLAEERATSFRFEPRREGRVTLEARGEGVKSNALVLAVGPAAVPVQGTIENVYLSVTANPNPAPDLLDRWETLVTLRLVEAKGSVVLAKLQEPLRVELEADGGTVTPAVLEIPAGMSSPARAPVFATQTSKGNAVRVVGLSHAVGHDPRVDVACHEPTLRVHWSVVPTALPSDGKSTATLAVEAREGDIVRNAPRDIPVAVEHTLRPGAMAEPEDLVLKKGTARVEAKLRSYTGGTDRITLSTPGLSVDPEAVEVTYAFPLWALVACLVAGLLVGGIHWAKLGGSWLNLLFGIAGAGLTWLLLRHGVPVREVVQKVTEPFTVSGSFLVGALGAGIADVLGTKLSP